MSKDTPKQMQHLVATNPDEFQLPNYIFTLNETDDLIGFMAVRHPFLGFLFDYREKLEQDHWFIIHIMERYFH